MSQWIRESAIQLPTQVSDEDLEKGIVDNVLVLTWESRNGLHYPREMVERHIALYDGASVNLDHRADPNTDVPVSRRFGRISQPRITPDGVRARLQFNPNHPFAVEFKWWIRNDSKGLGLSHYAQIKKKPKEINGRWVEVVESIGRVASVDIVADPATTNGIFESEKLMDPIADPATIGAGLTDKASLMAFLQALMTACPVTPEEQQGALEEVLAGMDSMMVPTPDAPVAMESQALDRLARKGRLGAWAAAKIKGLITNGVTMSRAQQLAAIQAELGVAGEFVSESLKTTLLTLNEKDQRSILANLVPRQGPKSAPPAGGTFDAKKVAAETQWN